MSETRAALTRTAEMIADYRDGLGEMPVVPTASSDELWDMLGGPLLDDPIPPGQVVEMLAYGAGPGLVATAGPRYFGFVIGGSLTAATCADLLATGWDQPAFNAATSPAAAVAEEVARRLVEGPARPTGRGIGRLRHRRPGGQHRRPGRSPAARAGQRLAGTSSATG